jgi:hypothetical protein
MAWAQHGTFADSASQAKSVLCSSGNESALHQTNPGITICCLVSDYFCHQFACPVPLLDILRAVRQLRTCARGCMA